MRFRRKNDEAESSTGAAENPPDVTQEYDESWIYEFLVELRQDAVGDKDAAEDEEGVDEEVPVEQEPSCGASVLLKTILKLLQSI